MSNKHLTERCLDKVVRCYHSFRLLSGVTGDYFPESEKHFQMFSGTRRPSLLIGNAGHYSQYQTNGSLISIHKLFSLYQVNNVISWSIISVALVIREIVSLLMTYELYNDSGRSDRM